MSVYTTELKFICEEAAGLEHSEGYQSVNEILDKARDKIFNFDYPIFDENYRNVLENKILKHYYTREIGLETVGLWKLKLDTKMNEIMPYYNQLYNSELIKFNPMYDTDLTTDYSKEHNGTDDKTNSFTEHGSYEDSGTMSEHGYFEEDGSHSENTNNTSESTDNSNTVVNDAKKNDHWDMYSDTPQGGINGVRDEKYLTNARHVTDDTTGSTTETIGNSANNSSSDTDIHGNNEKSGTNDKNSNEHKNGVNDKNGNGKSNEVIKNTEDYLHHVVGKSGGVSYSKMLKEFRQTFLNIDMKIIDELGDLFMNIY